MPDVGRVGRRVLPLLMFASGACLGEQVTVGRVVTSTDGASAALVPTAVSMVGVVAAPIDLPGEDPDPATCDLDGDGHESIACGGDDCDDRNDGVNPDVEENEDWGVEVMAEDASLASLAVDRRGVAHVVYREGSGPDAAVVYSTNDTGSWVPETVEAVGATSHRPSIALGANGRVHVCWTSFEEGTTVLGYATNATGSWRSEVDEWTGGAPTRCSIVVDPRGAAHVAYQDPMLGMLRYSNNELGRWQVELVDSARGTGAFPTLMMDEAYVPHIGYQDLDNFLHHAVRTPDGWRSEVVEDDFLRGDFFEGAFTLDAQSAAHVSYRAPGEHQLAYATNATGVWVHETPQLPGYSGVTSSIATDDNAFVHIAYSRDDRRNRPDDLLFATRAGGAWSTQVIDAEDLTGWDPTLLVGPTLLHVAYFRFTAGGGEDVMYGTRRIPDAIDADCDGEW